MEEPANPLFSSLVTLYALLLIYFPCYFLQIAFSPLLISTAILLLCLLRLGANQTQRTEIETESCLSGTGEIRSDPANKYIESVILVEIERDVLNLKPPIGWSVGAPLEVIYEDYEGEEEDDEIDYIKDDRSVSKMERSPSLSLYYPETDSDVSSTNGEIQDSEEWDSPERMFFRWEEEDRDGLIEIALDFKGKEGDFFHDEDENLIEIDIFPARMRKVEFSGECQVEIN